MSLIQSQLNKAIATAANYELLAALTYDLGRRANCQALAVFHEDVASELRKKLEEHIPDASKGPAQLRRISNKDDSMPRTFPERRPNRLTRWQYGGLVLGYATLTALFFWFALDWSSKLMETKPPPNVTTGIAPANQSGIPHPR
jgi:hypothetical protein